MKIAHISDTHGLKELVGLCATPDAKDAGLFVWSGDLYSNLSMAWGVTEDGQRYCDYRPKEQAEHQEKKARKYLQRLKDTCGDRPIVAVRGNHDYTGFDVLKEGGLNIYELTPENPSYEIGGVRFAGFHEVDWIYNGQWFGESKNYNDRIDQVLSLNPDVLVTHTPPYGLFYHADRVLTEGVSSSYLLERVIWTPSVKCHLFGHIHEDGGRSILKYGKAFLNAAKGCIVFDYDEFCGSN